MSSSSQSFDCPAPSEDIHFPEDLLFRDEYQEFATCERKKNKKRRLALNMVTWNRDEYLRESINDIQKGMDLINEKIVEHEHDMTNKIRSSNNDHIATMNDKFQSSEAKLKRDSDELKEDLNALEGYKDIKSLQLSFQKLEEKAEKKFNKMQKAHRTYIHDANETIRRLESTIDTYQKRLDVSYQIEKKIFFLAIGFKFVINYRYITQPAKYDRYGQISENPVYESDSIAGETSMNVSMSNKEDFENEGFFTYILNKISSSYDSRGNGYVPSVVTYSYERSNSHDKQRIFVLEIPSIPELEILTQHISISHVTRLDESSAIILSKNGKVCDNTVGNEHNPAHKPR
jgi:hypothetical protein